MVPELLNYKISILNPLGKMIVPIIFLIGTYLLYTARDEYGGELGKVVNRLCIAGLIGFLAMSIRFTGDYFEYWKWAESLGYVAMCVANVYAAWPLLTFIKK
jgi:hypothetical protein